MALRLREVALFVRNFQARLSRTNDDGFDEFRLKPLLKFFAWSAPSNVEPEFCGHLAMFLSES